MLEALNKSEQMFREALRFKGLIESLGKGKTKEPATPPEEESPFPRFHEGYAVPQPPSPPHPSQQFHAPPGFIRRNIATWIAPPPLPPSVSPPTDRFGGPVSPPTILKTRLTEPGAISPPTPGIQPQKPT